MVELRLGKIDNSERKFIPTKKEFFGKYLNGMDEIEEYELTQTYKDGYKYRRYNDDGYMKYTRNKKMGTITEVEEIDEDTFNKVINENGKWIRKKRKYYIDGLFEIDVDYFYEPLNMIMVEVATDKTALEDYIPPKGFIEVTGDKNYENLGIYNGSIKSNNTILEGTDGIGKTSTIERLIKKGILAQDRCMDVISSNMLFEISMEERVEKYQDYLKEIDKKIIILVNRDKDELERRINMRDVITEFDKEAFEYNQLYLETYLYMKKRNMLEGKMYMIDCTGLNLEEQVRKVEEIISAQ